MPLRRQASLVAAILVTSCTKQAPQAELPRGADSAGQTPAMSAVSSAAPEPPAAAASEPSADAGSPVAAGSSPGPDAGRAAESEPPRVKLVTIGMHVAGGPFDEPTKVPFKRAVEPHFPELARCWKHVPEPRQADAGVDLAIEPGGGHAKVSNPRSTIAGEGFLPCVVAFFETIAFDKTDNGGRRVVSYSVRFTPAPSR